MTIKAWVVVLAVLGGIGCVLGSLPPPQKSYKILMLLPMSSKSHRDLFLPLAEALADRGHKVVMLVNHAPSVRHKNIFEMNHGLPNVLGNGTNAFRRRRTTLLLRRFSHYRDTLTSIARTIYKVPDVRKLYERRKDFDVVFTEMMANEMMYPFVHEVPFITLCTITLSAQHTAVLGNPLSPAYAPNILVDFPRPLTFANRIANLVLQVGFAIYWRFWGILPYVQEEITAQFPDLPSLLELERNQSLSLINTHFSLGMSLPLLPSQVEVGGMHCRPGKPLSQSLKEWIEGAGPAGVVYFSLSTVAKGSSMPTHYRDLFLSAFSQLEQRVIWEFEVELEEVPDNVLIDKWLPQQDILADPGVKVFITHEDLLSSQEAIYHTTPVLVLPITADQPKTAISMQDSGFGLALAWEELTVERIVDSIKEIINNPKYTMKVQEASRIFRDQPEPPLERAVFWTEYVIRHRGAPILRSPAAELSWVEFLMLDVLAISSFVVFVAFYILCHLLRVLCGRAFSDGREKVKLE
ncbi:UDP-glycosyltransferase UGT5-like [Panulirus ornatus]|uniref:UDP-glycosyltransferase UGT5-like n=1 Tax=Panulirus ornatus TaxID=150431 RepID=UPI003A880284